jgi:ketosteroid isomerase-like protein
VSETTTQLVTQLLEAWNAHDVDRVAALYTPDYKGEDASEARP